MSTDNLDLLTVSASQEARIEAQSADIELTMRSGTLVRRNQDLGHAREIVQLFHALSAIGIDSSQTEIRAVYAETGNTLFKGNSARYHLIIRCPNLERLPDVLSAISQQKHSSLDQIIWRYGDEAAIHDELLAKALTRANTIARLSAKTIGTTIIGVHSIRESTYSDDTQGIGAVPRAASLKSRGRAESAELEEIPVTHTKRLKITVDVQYRIQGWQE